MPIWVADGALSDAVSWANANVVPVFCWRHFVVDRGKFPPHMLEDLQIESLAAAPRRAGLKPYVALGGGILAMIAGKVIFG